MQLSGLIAIFVIVLYTVEGHRRYGYHRKKSFIGSKKLTSKHDGTLEKKVISHRQKLDPCPPVVCHDQHIPIKCRKPIYFLKNGVKCKGCFRDICKDKIVKERVQQKHFINRLKDEQSIIPSKRIDVVEVPVKLPVNVPKRFDMDRAVPIRDNGRSIMGEVLDIADSVMFDRPNRPRVPPRHGDRLDILPLDRPNRPHGPSRHGDRLDILPLDRPNRPPVLTRQMDNSNPLELAPLDGPIRPIGPQRENLGPLDVPSFDGPNRGGVPHIDNASPLEIPPIDGPNQPRVQPRHGDSVGPFDLPPTGVPNQPPVVNTRSEDNVRPVDIPQNQPPVITRQGESVEPLVIPPQISNDQPPVTTRQIDSAVQVDIPPSNNQRRPIPTGQDGLNIDPAQVFSNSPPSDNAFVDRLRFDQNNINLLQPPIDEQVGQQQSWGVPNQLNGQGSVNPSVQNLQQSQQMLLMQNQQLIGELQAQQALLQQLQGQQTRGQLQGQQLGQVPMLPNNGLGQNMQGFPMWAQNPNQAMNVPQQVPGANGNPQMSAAQFLNLIPPVPGINTNLPAQGPVSGANSNFQGMNNNFPGLGSAQGMNNIFPGLGAPQGMNNNFPGLGVPQGMNNNFPGLGAPQGMNNNFPGLGVPQGMNNNFPGLGAPQGMNNNFPGLGAPQGMNNNFPGLGVPQGMNNNFPGLGAAPGINNNLPGSGSNGWGQGQQGSIPQAVPLIDPVTNQQITGSSNSLHGPVSNQ